MKKPANQNTLTGVAAFTLLELLIVLAIIGLLAAVGLPALKGLGSVNAIAAADRQLLDDLALARMRAINDRTTIYIVFAPPNPFAHLPNLNNAKHKNQLTNLVAGQYSAYALFAKRSVGDQPGREYPRFISNWRYLPTGVFVSTNKFFRTQIVKTIVLPQQPSPDLVIEPFSYDNFPFPSAYCPLFPLPYIAFNPQGQLASMRNEVIPLARGSIFYTKDAQDRYLAVPADVQELPPGNSIDPNTYNFIYINWLTGRSHIEKKEIQ